MVRGFRSTLVLFAVLVGLVAYIYFVDRNRPVGEVADRDEVFDSLEAEDIEELQIRAEDGESSRLQKVDGTWRIVEPEPADADESEISTMTSTLATLSVEDVVEEDAADLVRFGLEPARIEVTFRTGEDESQQGLLIGDRTPTGSEIFARLPDSRRVFLVSGFIDSTFNKNTFALRDKDILKFERGKVDSLEMTRGSTQFAFTKRDGDWTIAEPIMARGDFGVIESTVERLASAQMQRIVEPEAKDLRKYGLDRPNVTVVVGTGDERATLTLGRAEDAVVFAKDAARPMVFAVAPTIESDLFKPLEDFRRKDLFDARSFTATHAEFARDGKTVTFEKTSKDGSDVWTRAGGGEIERDTIDDLLSNITGLRANSFQERTHPSLKTPVLTATIRFGDGRMETVSFGRAGDQVYATRNDEPGTAVIDAAAFDEVIKTLEAAS